MLGDDANIVFSELLKRLLDIIKMMMENKNNGRTGEARLPKIKSGKISKKQFEKLRNNGVKFEYVTVPKEKIEELEKSVAELGGSVFTAKPENGSNAVIAVPKEQMEIVNTALKHIIAETVKGDPEALKIKNGSEKIDGSDMKITSDVLRSYDIPVYSFKAADGKYMNIVPKEFDGQYEAAVNEARKISEYIKNMEITRYEQISPLDGLDVYAAKMSPETIKALNALAKEKNIDIKFAHYDNSDVAVYPSSAAELVEQTKKDSEAALEESENWLIDTVDSSIAIMDRSLIESEDESSYFMRIPNTGAQDYLRIDKLETEPANNGRALSMKIDSGRNYTVYDRDRNVKSERSGAELARSYNTKSIRADKDTVTVKYGMETDRVELYNAKENKVISLGMDKADNIRTELLEQGISLKAAERLLKEIDEKLTEKNREIFAYSEEKSEIVYADIPNIGEYLAQSQLSQQLIGKAECIGEIPKDSGSKCCMYDKNTNKFAVLPVLPVKQVQAMLSQMGYSEISSKEIADRIVSSYRDSDKEKDIELDENKAMKFIPLNVKNPEIADMGYYSTENSTVLIKEDKENYSYMEIDKGVSVADVQKAIMNNFDIKDELSAAEIIDRLSKDGTVKTVEPVTTEDVTIRQVSVNYIAIDRNNETAFMPKNKLDTEKLLAMGVSEKTVQTIEKSLKRSEKEAQNPGRQTLGGLIKFAEDMREKINASKEKSSSKETVKEAAKGMER